MAISGPGSFSTLRHRFYPDLHGSRPSCSRPAGPQVRQNIVLNQKCGPDAAHPQFRWRLATGWFLRASAPNMLSAWGGESVRMGETARRLVRIRMNGISGMYGV